jgi:SAM-dependent methyltransferase
MSSYNLIASEYYDPALHPTCANFDGLSRKFLLPRIRALPDYAVPIIDVGCGRSLVAEAIHSMRRNLQSVTLLDSSADMLNHSRRWETEGARLIVADATKTELANCSFAVLVASLGDPYNTPAFWQEAYRLLKPNGICLFTTPSPEWAHEFRKSTQRDNAEFVLSDGSVMLVPSYIPCTNDQTAMIEAAGFSLSERFVLHLSDISGPVSSKLLSKQPGRDRPILRGFSMQRNDMSA